MSKKLRELQSRFDLYKEAKDKDIKYLEAKLQKAEEAITRQNIAILNHVVEKGELKQKLQAVEDSLMSDEDTTKEAMKWGVDDINDSISRVGGVTVGIKIQRERTKKALSDV